MLDVIRTSQKRKELDKLKTDGASKNIIQFLCKLSKLTKPKVLYCVAFRTHVLRASQKKDGVR